MMNISFKKFMITVSSALCTAMLFSACTDAIPNLSPADEQRVGEYAAMVMLKYDANHRSRLVDLSKIVIPEPEPVEEIVPEPEPEPEEPEEIVVEGGIDEGEEEGEGENVTVIDNTTEQPVEEINYTQEEVLGFADGVSLVYRGYQYLTSYPENPVGSAFSLDATAGKKFLVLNYTLYNQSGEAQSFNFMGDDSNKYVFKVVVNGEVSRTALITLLADDLSTYVGTVDNGSGEELVLLFEIDESIEISSLEFVVKNTDISSSVILE